MKGVSGLRVLAASTSTFSSLANRVQANPGRCPLSAICTTAVLSPCLSDIAPSSLSGFPTGLCAAAEICFPGFRIGIRSARPRAFGPTVRTSGEVGVKSLPGLMDFFVPGHTIDNRGVSRPRARRSDHGRTGVPRTVRRHSKSLARRDISKPTKSGKK